MCKNKERVGGVVTKIIAKLEAISESSAGKATLAGLRKSIGKPLSESPEIWDVLFGNMPDDYLGERGVPTDEEASICTALQLYALWKQGVSKKGAVLGENYGGSTEKAERGEENDKEETLKSSRTSNMGKSLRALRVAKKDTKSVDQRFNAMITVSTFNELTYHLRQMIKLLKSAAPNAGIDFARLAEDIYWFGRGYQGGLRINWAREYYRIEAKDN